MPKQNYYYEFSHQADEIKRQGVPVENPYKSCLHYSICCIIDSKSHNCSSYTCYNQKYKKHFYSKNEQKRLNYNHNALTTQINKTKNQIKALFTRLKSLKTHHKFLNTYSKKVLDHDTVVMDYLNKEDPLSPQDLQELDYLTDQHKAAVLAATDDPSLSQLQNDPSIQANMNFSAHNIIKQVGGSPSGS